MRSLSLVLLLLIVFSLAQAVSLQGGNDAVKCTLFNLVKTPVSQDQNNTQAALELDVGLLGARNATYELVDSKDNAYKPSQYKSLQPGRTLLVFAVPEAALFKLLKVTPTEGKPFSINWWKTPKGITGDLILRYYGIVDWATQPDQQAIAYNVSITNNGSTPIYLSPDNFTLLDQWGWPYYTVAGFTATQLEPKKVARVNLVFAGISPFSRPSALAYDYATDNQIAIDLDKDMGQLTDAQVYGTAAPKTPQSQTAQPAQTAQAIMKPVASTAPATSANPVTSMTPVASMTPAAFKTPVTHATTPAKAQGPSVASTQTSTSAPSGNKTAKDAKNQTKEKVLSLKDQINASRQRLSSVKGGTSGGSTVGKKINSSVEETRKRLEKVRQGLKSNQTQNNSTVNKT